MYRHAARVGLLACFHRIFIHLAESIRILFMCTLSEKYLDTFAFRRATCHGCCDDISG